MKALFIGGTGTISTEISKLCVQKGWDLTLLNRGKSSDRVPEGARVLCADIHDEEAVRKSPSGFGLAGTIDRIRYYCNNVNVVNIRSEIGEYTEIELFIPRNTQERRHEGEEEE